MTEISNAEKRRINKARKEREKKNSPAKKYAQKLLEAAGLPMYLKIKHKKMGKGNIARKQQLKSKKGKK
jgi:hypothetical protein